MSVDRLSRRRALTGLSTVGLLSVVGCLGDSRQLTVGVGPLGSRSHQAGHALAVAADRHSDQLSVRVESGGPPSHRLYAVSNDEMAGAGVDNTTLYRASEGRGVFELDPVAEPPHQGFAYGFREQYWLAVGDRATAPESTAALADRVVYPGQPSEPSRLVTEQLLRDAELWDTIEVDNRPQADVPAAVDQQAVDWLAAVQHGGQQLADWVQAVDDRVGDRLAAVPPGPSLQTAIDDAPNALARNIEPVGWANAELGESVDGWAVPMQWLWSPSADPEAVAELTRIAAEQKSTLREVDPLAVGGDPERLAASVIDELAVHEGTAEAFDALGVRDSDWTVGDAVD